MKIDGNDYNFSNNQELKKEELFLTNKALLSVFDFFDKNKDGVLKSDEISEMFDFYEKMDSKTGNNNKELSDTEIESATKNNSILKKITIYDIKTFIKNAAGVTSAKQLAIDLKAQIEGWSLNAKTKNLLKKLNKTNAAETLNEYKKITQSNLDTDLLNETSIISTIDINTVKNYICKPLVEQAISLGIKNFTHSNYSAITDENKINSFIKNLAETILAVKSRQTADIAVINSTRSPFDDKTRSNFEQIPHKTKLLDVAQKYLGLQEVTEEEYKKLTPYERKLTQMAMIKDKGNVNHQWCAHTVSTLCEITGIDIGGHKSSVYKSKNGNFVDWAKENNTWHPIKTIEMTDENYITERENRRQQIKKQIANMNEGDFIIWSSQYLLKAKGVKHLQFASSSHIGIIESVDTKAGTVTVIEGNANVSYTGSGFDRSYVETIEDSLYGNQDIGEYKEINRRDGLIRKTYTIKELAKFGYSGFIDNQNIIK